MMVTSESLTRKLAPGESRLSLRLAAVEPLTRTSVMVRVTRAVTARVTRTVTVTVGPSPADYRDSVSYTHLTLPTIYSV